MLGKFGIIWNSAFASTHKKTVRSQHHVGSVLSEALADPGRPLVRHVGHFKQGGLELQRGEPDSTHHFLDEALGEQAPN